MINVHHEYEFGWLDLGQVVINPHHEIRWESVKQHYLELQARPDLAHEPISVRWRGRDRRGVSVYEVVNGHHRYLAAVCANRRVIGVLIEPDDDMTPDELPAGAEVRHELGPAGWSTSVVGGHDVQG